MHWLRSVLLLLLTVSSSFAATFGTVFSITGGASDLEIDEPRGRLYLVRPAPYNLVDVYSISQRRVTASIRTSANPLSAAMSRDGRFLYVVAYDATALDIIDLNRSAVARTVSLPARPEGVAVGGDERVLLTTIGTGPNNSANTLLIFDPNAEQSVAIGSVVTAPPQPTPPNLPPPSGRVFLASRSQLIATRDGRYIIGLNNPNASTRTVFVYETASGTVLRSRSVGGLSSVFSVSPDGSKFMAGLSLFETETLAVVAQQNAANAPFPLSTNITAQGFTAVGNQFNTQTNQGGSAFAPDGSALYSAFNLAPVQNPPARANISQLLISDPDNLLVKMAVQLPENLAGKMVTTEDGAMLFALSESGMTILPMGTLPQSPIGMPDSTIVFLGNDQCGVTADKRTGKLSVQNVGRGRLTVNTQLLQGITTTAIQGLGGVGGAGGGAPGQGVVIVLPPVAGAGLPGTLPAGQTAQQAQVTQTAPQVATDRTPDGADLTFRFNPNAGRATGTVAPHDYIIQANEMVNVAPSIRVFQNNRNSETRADLVPIPVGISPNEGLVDLVADNTRQLVYIANSGLNRVDVFDMRTNELLAPIKVGQLPRSLAISPEGNTLYVANSGGENISIVDLEKRETVGRITFPPIPFNANFAIVTPSALAATQRGLQIVMSNGTLWKAIGDVAIPRAVSPIIGSSTVTAPRSIVSTPNGEYALLLDGSGNAYLYDAMVDDYVQRRQLFPNPIQGYYGPVGAGPRGNYFLANGLVLNQSLTAIQNAGVVVVPPQRAGQAATQYSRPISAVAPVGTTQFARFAQPLRMATNTLTTDDPVVEVVDVNTGATLRTSTVLEGPISTLVGTQRVNVVGKSLAVNPSGTTAYLLTTSGLSVVNLERVTAEERVSIARNGLLNMTTGLPALAPGSLLSVFGTNLASQGSKTDPPLPTVLGGVCVTANNRPLPLLMTSPGQINMQIPPDLAAGRYTLVVRSVDLRVASTPQSVTLSKFAPAVMVDDKGQAAVFHEDGKQVTRDYPARRDERLVLYATGLGPTKGGKVVAGEASPADPPAETANTVEVFFGDPGYKQSAIVVEWAGLAAGLVGVYQVNLYVPGFRMRGDALPVTLKAGGVSTPSNLKVTPTTAVE